MSVVLNSTTSSFIADEYETTDATPSLIFSLPTDTNKQYEFNIKYRAQASDKSNVCTGSFFQQFKRQSGNISTLTPTDEQRDGDYANPQPYAYIVGNTSTNQMDIYAVGKASTTINWHIQIARTTTA